VVTVDLDKELAVIRVPNIEPAVHLSGQGILAPETIGWLTRLALSVMDAKLEIYCPWRSRPLIEKQLIEAGIDKHYVSWSVVGTGV